jgi:transposase
MREKITLKKKEIKQLKLFVKKGVRNARELERGYVLLALHKKKKIEDIADFYMVSRTSVWRLKSKYETEGLDKALKDDPRSGQPQKYKDKEEAEIVALACTDAPEGRARWTLDLMKQKLQKQQGLQTINRETIRLTLKKNNVNLG